MAEKKHTHTTDEQIAEVYNSETGFGSLATTYQDVKKKYPNITFKDVKSWYGRNAEYNVRSTGYNSFVASAPLQEFQVDLFNMKGREGGKIQNGNGWYRHLFYKGYCRRYSR